MGDTSSEFPLWWSISSSMSANGGSRWIPDGTRRVSVVFCWTVDCNTLRASLVPWIVCLHPHCLTTRVHLQANRDPKFQWFRAFLLSSDEHSLLPKRSGLAEEMHSAPFKADQTPLEWKGPYIRMITETNPDGKKRVDPTLDKGHIIKREGQHSWSLTVLKIIRSNCTCTEKGFLAVHGSLEVPLSSSRILSAMRTPFKELT